MKDAYYFPHFSNARHDRKIKRVRKELGLEGYGIFFMLLEILREQTDLKYPLDELDLLADEFGTSEAKVRTVVCNYQLFDVDENQNFFSPKLLLYLQPYFEKSEHARMMANKRWHKKDAIALPEQCPGYASKVNKSKVDQSKVKQLDKSKTDYEKVINHFNNNIHPVVPIEAEQLSDWLNDIDSDSIILAIDIAIKNGARKLNYINAILKDWVNKGFKTKLDIEAYQRDYEDKKKGNNKEPPTIKKREEPEWIKILRENI